MTDTKLREAFAEWRKQPEVEAAAPHNTMPWIAIFEAGWRAATPPGGSPRPNVIGASPVCLDCNVAGLRNCSHFDNCDGNWVYKPTPVASEPERTPLGEPELLRVPETDDEILIWYERLEKSTINTVTPEQHIIWRVRELIRLAAKGTQHRLRPRQVCKRR